MASYHSLFVSVSLSIKDISEELYFEDKNSIVSLILFTELFYFVNLRLWHDLKSS